MSGAAAAAAIAQATKASGVLITLEPGEFAKILRKASDPVIVVSHGGVFKRNYQYLMSYKGLAFHCKSAEPLSLPSGAEVVAAKSLWIP